MTVFSRMHQLRAPWMAWWLALALVVAPALGRMHEVLHAPQSPPTAAVAAHAIAHTHTHTHADHLHDLFGVHSQLECLVFDQLGHGSNFLPAITWFAHTAPETAPIWSTDPAALPVALAVFKARAPPHVTA